MISSIFGAALKPALEPALESAARSLLVAGVVWAGLRAFRVRSVPAQKTVWGLVLAAAVAMPFLLPLAARWKGLPIGATLILPRSAMNLSGAEKPLAQPANDRHIGAANAGTVRAERLSMPGAVSAFPTAQDISASSARVENVGNHIADDAQWTEPNAAHSSKTASVAPIVLPEQNPIPSSTQPISILKLAWMLYLSVTAGLLLRLLLGLASAFRLWHGAEPVKVEATRGGGALHLRASRAVASPVTIGSGIVLPADYADWDAEKLRIVLAHERSHIRQGDFYLQLIAGLYAILFWFSPLGWWLKRRLSDLAEAISDRAGLSEAASGSSYAQVLLEFAAKPRPTHLGVAMARSGSLSRRIDRVLNDRAFQQSFATNWTRIAAAVLLVPAAVFAATSLIRVQAAAQAPQSAPAAQPAPAAQAAPAPPVLVTPDAKVVPDAKILPDAKIVPDAKSSEMEVVVPSTPPIGPIHLTMPRTVIVMPKMAPMPRMTVVIPKMDVVVPKIAPMPKMVIRMPEMAKLDALRMVGPGVYTLHGPDVMVTKNGAYVLQFSTDGDTFVLVKRNEGNEQLYGSWADGHREEIEKARKLAHGDFLWFTQKGKSYFIDDPAIVASVEASMDAMNAQQEMLGKQQSELGRQQAALGRQQEELSRHLAQMDMRTPHLDEEIAKVQAALGELKAKQGSTMTAKEWADIQDQLGELQGKLGAMRAHVGLNEGDFGGQMSKLGAEQGDLGAKQGKLGERQGRLADAERLRVQTVINDSLRSGKAHPVQ